MKSSTARKAGKQNIAERKAVVFKQRLMIGAVIALIALYLIVALYYAFHFEPRSVVNGIDVSGLSLKAAKEKLKAVADTYTLRIEGPGDAVQELEGSQIGLEIADAAGARQALRAQPCLTWLTAVFRDKTYQVDLATASDSAALTAYIDGLPMLDEESMEPPEDASLKVDESGAYVIVPEKIGTTLRTDEARAMIVDAVANARTEVDLTKALILPEIYETDANLITRRDEWNTFLTSSGLTYRVGGSEEVLDGSVIASLLEDDGEHVDLSYAKTADLMAKWREAHDTYHCSFKFMTHSGVEVNIEPYGDYGYELNEEDTCADVMEKIKAHDRGTYDAQYYHEAPYSLSSAEGGTYIEVSVTQQHLWAYKDGEVVFDTDVVTGLPVYGSTTYYGCYAIKKKEQDVTLGQDDVPDSYNPTVKYWLPFNAGEGIHDAGWRDAFGGRIWITHGSHGCVNVPDWCMGDLFNLAEVGEAVVVYGRAYDESVNDRNVKTVNEDYYYDVFYKGE